MKKKVGELYDKPIVIGNPNEFTKNEIALSELEGGSSDILSLEYYIPIKQDTETKILIDSFYDGGFFSITDNNLVKGIFPQCVGFAISPKIMQNKTYNSKEWYINKCSSQGKNFYDYFKQITESEFLSLLN
jgi:hypothetical protein